MFDRNADGTIHQKAFAGQTFDRTVHKGDLTGIEIVNRLPTTSGARRRRLRRPSRARSHSSPTAPRLRASTAARSAPASLMVRARATLLATGGGATMYRTIAVPRQVRRRHGDGAARRR